MSQQYDGRHQRARARRRRQCRRRLIAAGVFLVLLLLLIFLLTRCSSKDSGSQEESSGIISQLQTLFQGNQNPYSLLEEDWVTQDLLPINEYSRPGDSLPVVWGIVVHYVGNPGTTAQQNRNYFASLANSHDTSASSHFVIGLEGEVIQCVPMDEISYCSNDRNEDTLSIECCHPGEDGAFNQATYDSLVRLLRTLCDLYELDEDDIIRHYDVTGKKCPLYYVDHPDAWEQLKNDVFDPNFSPD